MKFKRKLSGILAVLMLLSSVSYGAGAAETEAVTENINTAETETTTDTENETDDTPVVKTLEFPVDVPEESTQTSQVYDYGLCENIQDGVILHAFCWPFKSIELNMQKIAEVGYTAIQTSPPSMCNSDPNRNKVYMSMNGNAENPSNGAWYWHYQPIDFKIGNYQLGTKRDYIDMCAEADEYGIKVIADIVSNHTTTSIGNVEQDLINAVHGEKNNGTISNLYHSDRLDGSLSGRYKHLYHDLDPNCADINTENPDYQYYLVQYLNALVDAGCDGFRFDTAKHIALYTDERNSENVEKGYTNDFWDVATGQKPVTNNDGQTIRFNRPDDFFIYGEIIQDGDFSNDKIPYYEYGKYMGLTATSYGVTLRGAIAANNFSERTINVIDWNHRLAADQLVSWVESHDTYCNNHESAGLSNEQIRLAWAALAARKETTPLFFSRPRGSNENGKGVWGDNILYKNDDESYIPGNDEYKCEIVSAVNNFRNAMVGQDENLKNPNNDQYILQIDRGSLGTCIINLKNEQVTLNNLSTDLGDGKYKDSVSQAEITVSNGQIQSCTIAKRSVAVIYTTVKMSASNNNAVFSTSGYNVNLKVSGIIEGSTPSYTISADGYSNSGTFSNEATTIDIGSGVNVSGTSKVITLTLTATDENGVDVSKTFTYVKRDPNDITYVYFDNSSYNWSTPSVYVYSGNGSSAVSNHAWPGEIMTLVPGTNYYKYEVPYDLKNGEVIFYAGSNKNFEPNINTQYPAPNDGGLPLNGKTMLFSANYSWTGFEPSTIYDTDNEPELEEPESESSGKKRYIYYFNSLGRTDTINGDNTSANIKARLWKSSDSNSESATYSPMSWSESLHCYYYEFAESEGYDRVQFQTGSSTSSQEVISEGKVFVPVSESNNEETGEWISPTDIYEHTIYFDNAECWTNVNAYLWDGALMNAKHPGEEMTSLGEVAGFGDHLYSYTYYYPRLKGSKKTDYVKVQFNNRPDDDKRKTSDLNVVQPSDTGSTIIVYNNSGNDYYSEKTVTEKSGIKVKVHYSDTKLDSNGSIFSTDTDTDITVSSTKAENAVAVAISQISGENAYNELLGYTTQFDYVKELAKSYGANISPEKFIHQSGYFSGIGQEYNENVDKWVTFKDSQGNELLPNQIKPDLSNLENIEVYLWAKAKTYKVDFSYPTQANETLTSFNSNLYFSNSDTVQMHSQKRYYNEPISSNNTPIIDDMVTPEGKVFDGWYSLNIYDNSVNSYYKVSSYKNYNCRVTSNLTLYAVFRDEGTEVKPGATTTTSGVDDYTADANGTVKHRFNTILNIYNCERSDPNITNVGVVYVRYASAETNYNISAVKTALSQGTNSIISREKTIGATIPPDLTYDYYTYPIGTNGYKLTNMNRIQFSLNKTDDEVKTGDYCNVIAFTTFKYGDKWYISDNCVLYKNGDAKQMPAVN